jgi:hypothetical protein
MGLDVLASTTGATATTTFFSFSLPILGVITVHSPAWGVLVTGLVMGLGANPTHELIRTLQEVKKNRTLENTPVPDSGTPAQSAPTSVAIAADGGAVAAAVAPGPAAGVPPAGAGAPEDADAVGAEPAELPPPAAPPIPRSTAAPNPAASRPVSTFTLRRKG